MKIVYYIRLRIVVRIWLGALGNVSDKNWCSITFKFIESTLSLLCVTIKKTSTMGIRALQTREDGAEI